ncbi:hypothetical protein D9M72_479730 [compost metagenome]
MDFLLHAFGRIGPFGLALLIETRRGFVARYAPLRLALICRLHRRVCCLGRSLSNLWILRFCCEFAVISTRLWFNLWVCLGFDLRSGLFLGLKRLVGVLDSLAGRWMPSFAFRLCCRLFWNLYLRR